MLRAVILLSLEIALGEIAVVDFISTIYDRGPMLRIKGSGFDADAHETVLELSSSGQPDLICNMDYTITKDTDNDGIVLKLLTNRRSAIQTTHNFFCFLCPSSRTRLAIHSPLSQ